MLNRQEERIINGQGLTLAALLRAADPAVNCSGEGAATHAAPGKAVSLPPLIIVCHGFTGSKEGGGGAMAMADELAGCGFAVLLFDFTGCGESEGVWEEITLSRQVEDLGAVVRWARRQGYRRIILNGRSFGGATVLAYAASDRQIAAVCTWAAVARPLQLFNRFAGEKYDPNSPLNAPVLLDDGTGSICLQRRFFEDLRRHNLPGSAARIAPRPLLLIHGSADEVVPVADVRLLYDAAGEPKKLALVKGADHSFSDHRRQVWDIFFEWLITQKWLGR